MSLLPALARDRIWESFRTLVGLETAQMRFLGTYEYTIQATDAVTVDATANDTSTGMPDVSRAELRADTISTQLPTVGNLCHIIFVDGNPSKPKCVWCQPQPTQVAIAGGGAAVGRVGDGVQVTFTTAEVAQVIAPAGTAGGPCSAVANITISGVITAGSPKVTSG